MTTKPRTTQLKGTAKTFPYTDGSGDVQDLDLSTDKDGYGLVVDAEIPAPLEIAGQVPGRLSLSATIPVPVTDLANVTTVYIHPYNGRVIWLRNSQGGLSPVSLNGVQSQSLSGLSGSAVYDIFVSKSGSSIVTDLESWASATARSQALVLDDWGREVKDGDEDHLYYGTFRLDSGSYCQDAVRERFLWPKYNRVKFADYSNEPTDSWLLNSALWLANNGGAAVWKHEFVIGLEEYPMIAQVFISVLGDALYPAHSIGLDNPGFNPVYTPGIFHGAIQAHQNPKFTKHTGIGYHYLQGIERNSGAGNSTIYGDAGIPTWLGGGMLVEGER